MVGVCYPSGEESVQLEKGLLVSFVYTVANYARELPGVGVEVPIGGIHNKDMGLNVGGRGVGSATKQGDFGEDGEH